MNLDPTKMSNWQIAAAAEQSMKPVTRLAEELGLKPDELLPIGRQLAKIDYAKAMERLGSSPRPKAKYIDITAITPTPLGEGKTTTVIGLIEGLGKLGKKVTGAIRQPSSGPTFNIKGSAAGAGLAQCIPLAPMSVGFTGDIDRVTNSHNLAMVALTARIQHEKTYGDSHLEAIGMRRLNIEPANVRIKWTIDFCAQALRNITISKGSPDEMVSGFAIAASSELMAILAVCKDLADLRQRIARIVVACDKNGKEITTADLEVDGAMTAWMLEALNPNLVQTIEGQPVFVHAGPFANIAIGQSSVIADLLAIKLADYHITESGFGADMGYEKFWNLKCRISGLKPDAVVIVATIRALKMHGGGPAVKPGKPLGDAYIQENLALLETGCGNLIAHIEIVKRSGITPIVCVNKFSTDTKSELELVRKVAAANGALAVCSDHWLKGGKGAVELAEAVIDSCGKNNSFKPLYDPDALPLRKQIELLATEIYGASGVTYSPAAIEKAIELEADPQTKTLGTCMVKTHLSLSHDPTLKGRPTGWTLPVTDFLIYRGAGLVAPVAGDIKLMPGTGSNPAFRHIDVDIDTARIVGLS